MEDTYLVEIRLARTRWRIKETICAISQQFGVEHNREEHPHITLYGPFTFDDPSREQDLLDTIRACAARTGPVLFTLGGWERRDGTHGGVVAFSVRASPELATLTATLAQALSRFTISLNAWDLQPDKKWFHATIVNRLLTDKSSKIMEGLAATQTDIPSVALSGSVLSLLHAYLAALTGGSAIFSPHRDPLVRPVLLDDAGLRITVMRNDDILGEYDLLFQRWLTPEEIKDPFSWQKTMAQYRRYAGFECSGPVIHNTGETFLISDLHLGHANIIKYCSRPFVPSDPDEMDRVLVANWNYCISQGDRVFYLGDLKYGNNARPETEYRALLNGAITFVAGNHDTISAGTIPSVHLTFEGQEFLLVHDPADASGRFSGWIIHGHHHNNNLRAFPYIDPVRKRINVSAEVIGYYPVSLQEICRTIREKVIPTGEPLPLRYPYIPL